MTISEIASLAGVSRGTVDRVINKRGSVNPEKEKKILEIIEENGFVPNKAGKTLAVKKKNLKLGFVLCDSSNSDFFLEVEKGIASFEAEFSEYGVEVLRAYTAISDVEARIKAIDDLVAKGISGLAIIPEDSDLLCKKLSSLVKAGIPVVTVNSDLSCSDRMAYVGSDYRKAGETAGGILGLLTGGKGKVGIVLGSFSVPCHTERAEGFSSVLSSRYPDLKIAGTVCNNDNNDQSELKVRDLLEDREIDALYLAAAGVTGACKAIKESGREIMVVSHDTYPPVDRLILDGTIKATIFQNPFEQGRRPLKILFEKLGFGTEPEKKFFYTRSEVVIRENLSEFMAEGENAK